MVGAHFNTRMDQADDYLLTLLGTRAYNLAVTTLRLVAILIVTIFVSLGLTAMLEDHHVPEKTYPALKSLELQKQAKQDALDRKIQAAIDTMAQLPDKLPPNFKLLPPGFGGYTWDNCWRLSMPLQDDYITAYNLSGAPWYVINSSSKGGPTSGTGYHVILDRRTKPNMVVLRAEALKTAWAIHEHFDKEGSIFSINN